MKHIGTVLALVLAVSVASAQKSDYETVKSFEAKYKTIKESIKAVKTVQECAEVSTNIDELEKEFAGDRALLDKSLYPDKYDDRITEVRVQLRLAQEKLGIIESQVTRIAELEAQVRMLSGKVDSLAGENSRLMGTMDKMNLDIKSAAAGAATTAHLIDSLRGVIAKLQQGLKERDNMIFALVDSLFMQYDKNIEGLPDQQKKVLIGKVERNNVIAGISRSVQDNLKFLELTQLSGKDLAEMIKQQRKFSSYWKGLGPKLATLYLTGKDKKKQMETVDTLLATWGTKADAALWNGLNAEFTSNNIPLQTVHSGDEFFKFLSSYLDAQIHDSKASSEERLKQYTHFAEQVWQPSVGTVWMPMLVDEGKLTKDQEKELRAKVDAWKSSTQPTSPLFYATMFIVVVIVLIVVYQRMRKRPAPPPVQP